MKKTTCLSAGIALSIAGTLIPAGQASAESETVRLANFTEPFSDPGAETAQAYSKTSGISLSEASRRLRLMNDAARLVHSLETQFPTSFSGAEATEDGSFQIAVYGTAQDIGAITAATKAFAGTTDLASVVSVRTASSSIPEIAAQARAYLKAVNALGLQATIASNARTGQIKLLAKDPTAALAALVSGRLRAAAGVRIEQFDGIVTTATEVPGGQNFEARFSNGDIDQCTRGFNVKQISGALYGVTTAGHCENTSARDETTNIPLAFKEEWVTNGVDSQWHTFSGSANYLVVPKFYNGTSIVNVSGASSDYSGQYICKYGRSTRQTCGYVDPYQYHDSYGDFPRMNYNSTFPRQSLEGDSGGPVYTGTLAVGQVHGRDGGNPTAGPYTNMYYTPLRAWTANNVSIGVTCYC